MADEEHVSAELLTRFLSKRATKEESERALAHLLQGCDACSSLASRLLAEGVGGWYPKRGEPATLQQIDEMLDRAFAVSDQAMHRLADERLRGWALWSALDRLLPEERMRRVLNDPTSHTLGFHQRLVEATAVQERRGFGLELGLSR